MKTRQELGKIAYEAMRTQLDCGMSEPWETWEHINAGPQNEWSIVAEAVRKACGGQCSQPGQPPKDGTLIVARGQLFMKRDTERSVLPFQATLYWNTDESICEPDWMHWPHNLTLRESEDDQILFYSWYPALSDRQRLDALITLYGGGLAFPPDFDLAHVLAGGRARLDRLITENPALLGEQEVKP